MIDRANEVKQLKEELELSRKEVKELKLEIEELKEKMNKRLEVDKTITKNREDMSLKERLEYENPIIENKKEVKKQNKDQKRNAPKL